MSVNYRNLDAVIKAIENRKFMADAMAGALAEGIPPWGKRSPRLITTGLPVTGAARFVLSLEARKRGFQGRHWGSMSEWEEVGYPAPPETAVAGFLDSRQGDRRVIKPVVLYSSDAVGFEEDPSVIVPDHAMADRIFDASGCRLKRRAIKPKWRREGNLDWIEMPYPDHMIYGLDGYYSLLFHEMTHWVVLGGRLGERFSLTVHQSEFLTNLAAAILCDTCNIPFLLPISTKHVMDQIRGLKNPDYLFESIDIAERAAEFILKGES